MKWTYVAGALAGATLAGGVAALSTGSAHERPVVADGPVATAPDAALIDQDGREVRFAALVEGRVAVVNAFYTSCAEICPAMAATLAGVADGLGARLGDDVVMISLSLDPATDTPERLRGFAAKHGGRPGWHFLTGDRVALARLVDALGLGGGAKESHSPVLLLGAPGRTPWVRASGFSSPAVVAEQALALAEEG